MFMIVFTRIAVIQIILENPIAFLASLHLAHTVTTVCFVKSLCGFAGIAVTESNGFYTAR